MRIPEYVAIAQWVLLLTLGVLVTVMFRQLGRHLGVAKSSPALGPIVGTPAAGFEYARVDSPARELFEPAGGRPSLLVFADPTCPACEELVAALNQAHADGGLAGVRPLILISEPASYLQISEPFRDTPLPVGRLVAGSARQAYRVSATPLLVAVDGAGVVRAAGPATRPADVAAFVRAGVLAPPEATLTIRPATGRAPGHDPVTAGTVTAGTVTAGPVTAGTGEERGNHG